MPKISLILPVCNVASYLKRCLLSIEGFLGKGCQVILVNDGSTDNSPYLMHEFVSQHSTKDVIYIEQKNSGLSAARNAGIRKATGEYIWFIDTDDWLEDGAIDILNSKVLEMNADLIIMGRIERYPGKSRMIPKNMQYEEFGSGIQYFEKSIFEGKYRTQVWDKIIKRSIIVQNHLKFDEGLLYEDMLFMLRLISVAKLTITYPLYFYNYNQSNTGSISKTVRKKDLDILAFIEMSDKFVSSGLSALSLLSESYNLLLFNWVSTCLLNKYAQLSYTNNEAKEIYDKAIAHPIFKRAVKICLAADVGIRRRVFAWLIMHIPSLYKKVLIMAIKIKNLL